MSYTPTSPLGIAQQKLRRMLALSSTFQTQTGKDYTGTLNYIAYIEDEKQCFPRACVSVLENRYEQVAGGAASWLRPSGALHLYVAIEPDLSIEDREEQRLKGADLLLQIADDVVALAGYDDADSATSHLNILRMTVLCVDEVPEELRPTAGHFFWLEASVEIGD